MRIVIVSDFYLDYVGGAQSSIQEQRAALREAGHDVFLLAAARKARGEYDGGLELSPLVTTPGVDFPIIPISKKLVARLVEWMRRKAVDVVHLQTEFGLAHAAAHAARELGIPVVHTVHTFYWQSHGWFPTLAAPGMRLIIETVTRAEIPRRDLSPRPSDSLLRNMTLAMASAVDMVISPSAHQAEDLRAAGVGRPVTVVPNPIARSSSPAQELTIAQSERPRFLWVARCEPEKRPLVFAEAVVAALREAPDSFEVDFVGDGAEIGALRSIVQGSPTVRVHGNLPHERVVDLMDESAMVVLTSVGFDNQPMTIAEATSRYRGVLYCDPKLSEGLSHAGALTEGTDAAAITATILDLVRNPQRLRELSAGAKLDSATFSGAAYVERIMQAYTDAAAQS